MSFTTLRWLFPVAVTLHEAEEAVTMPAWVSAHSHALPFHPGATRIRLGLLLVTAAAYPITWCSVRSGRQSISTYLLFGYAAAMLANVIVPHVPATLIFRSYTPGVVSAVLINVPIMSALLVQALRQHWVLPGKAAVYALLVSLGLAGVAFALISIPARARPPEGRSTPRLSPGNPAPPASGSGSLGQVFIFKPGRLQGQHPRL